MMDGILVRQGITFFSTEYSAEYHINLENGWLGNWIKFDDGNLIEIDCNHFRKFEINTLSLM